MGAARRRGAGPAFDLGAPLIDQAGYLQGDRLGSEVIEILPQKTCQLLAPEIAGTRWGRCLGKLLTNTQ